MGSLGEPAKGQPEDVGRFTQVTGFLKGLLMQYLEARPAGAALRGPSPSPSSAGFALALLDGPDLRLSIREEEGDDEEEEEGQGGDRGKAKKGAGAGAGGEDVRGGGTAARRANV